MDGLLRVAGIKLTVIGSLPVDHFLIPYVLAQVSFLYSRPVLPGSIRMAKKLDLRFR